jgi:hypothetical protein
MCWQVWGRLANYSVNLPPKSYINVDEFSSPSHFKKYINALDSDDALYEEHHAWRKTYENKPPDDSVPIDPYWMMCKYMHMHYGEDKAPINIKKLRGAESCSETQANY